MFEFVIPLHFGDLRSKSGVNQYVVDEVFPMRLLPSKVKDCRNSYRSKGPLAVLETFDTIYSVLKHIHDVEPELKEDSWSVIVKAIPAHASLLVELLESSSTVQDSQLRQQHLNAVKMEVYLLCQFLDVCEAETTKPTNVATGKGRKKTKGSNSAFFGSMDWDQERERAVMALPQLLNLGLHRLWDPPVVEEEFINLVSGVCYKLLENTNINKNKTTRDHIFHLLGIMVKKYNHSLSCSVKLIQLLQHWEHLAAPLASCVALLVDQYNARGIAGELMREIGRMDPRDLARDTSGTRAYAAFLVELAEKTPAAIIQHISVLMPLLDGESYTMRNSVLGVLGEMVVTVLSKEDASDKDRHTRDQFLDRLEDHIHDVNAFCRSRSIQIWLHIVSARCLPVSRQHTLLELAIGRLMDRSSSVRKYAVQLITALLKNNPFAAKLPIDELQANYEKEKEKFIAMKPDNTEQDRAKKEVVTAWEALEPELKKVVLKHFSEDGEEEEEEEEEEEDTEESKKEGAELIKDDDTEESIRHQIMDCIKNEDFIKAIKLLSSALDAFPSSASFGPTQVEITEETSADVSIQQVDKAADFMYRFKLMYWGHHLSEKIANGSSTNQAEDAAKQAELAKQQTLVQYLKDSLAFTTKLQAAITTLCHLLCSKTTSDVLETIEFFATAFEFDVSNVMSGVRRMLVLMWAKEPAVKEAVVEAYKRLYMKKDGGGNARARSVAVANNLTALTFGATMGDLTSLEQLLIEFVASGDLDAGTIQVLWERFAMKIPATTEMESRAALQLLAMAAGAQVEIVKSNVDVLVKEGLGPRAEKDFLLARDTCNALIKLAGSKKKKAGEYEEPYRLPEDHEMFERLAEILTTGVTNLDECHWIPLCEQAVNVIYKLAEHPDTICGRILKKIAACVMSQSVETTAPASQPPSPPPAAQEDTTDEATPSTSQQEDAAEPPSTSTEPPSTAPAPAPLVTTFQCPSGLLTRLLSMAGHIAFKQLVHVDVAIYGELKRRRAVTETKKEKDKKEKEKQKSKKESKSEATEEEEMGLAGAAAEDAEAEYMRRITETELVEGSNLLSVLRPLLVSVCTNQAKYSDPHLQAAASLALAKYMLVSSEFCDSHLQLLFTILEKSSHPLIRANTIVALGDLTFRFPNLIEPWTPNLYARLRDSSPNVRKNTLLVLTRLILNDMVKVKGQISELATCIVDDDVQIAGLSRLFFTELAKKGNAIYNIMPDMVSRLSDPDIGVTEEHFQTIMKYLFAFIQKDRQCESLVEKLCHRFRATRKDDHVVEGLRCDRQSRDLAFCLSMLTYSEKSMRKLQENFPCFADKLHDEEVYNSFIRIIAGAKSFAKPEAKAAVEEFEQVLEQVHNKGVEDEEAAMNANKVSAAARALKDKNKSPGRRKSTAAKGRTPRKQKPKAKNPLYTKEEKLQEEEEEEAFHPAKRRGGGGGKGKPKLVFSSDEESDMEMFSQDKAAAVSDDENVPRSPSAAASPDHLKAKSRTSKKSVSSSGRTTTRQGVSAAAGGPPRRGNIR